MIESSTTKAIKVQSNSPYQLDPVQTLRAAKALTAHIKSLASAKIAQSTKQNLLTSNVSAEDALDDDPVPVWLIVTTKKHVVDKKHLKPAKIALPHGCPVPANRICLITADPQRPYKDLIEEPAFPRDVRERIGRVVGYSKLKAKYNTYEARRQLYAEYDMFLADDRIVTYLPTALGKIFYKTTTKRPVPVHLMGNEKVHKDAQGKKPKKASNDKSSTIVGSVAAVTNDIQKALRSALVHLSPSATTAIRVAHAGLEPVKIVENIQAVVNGLTAQDKLIPQGWKNIRSLHIKGPMTAAVPIWLADQLWLDEEDVMVEKYKPVDKTERLKIESVKARSEDKPDKKRKSLDSAGGEIAEKRVKKLRRDKAQCGSHGRGIALRKDK